MERDEIIRKVLARMDEVTHAEQVEVIPDPAINQLLEDGLRTFLMTVPVHLIKSHIESFASSPAYPYADNATGYVPLPGNFLRLVIFRMEKWKQPVVHPIYSESPEYQLQFNRYLRGSIDRPVVAIRTQSSKGQILEYYSTVNNNHVIAEALCVGMTDIEHLQDDLVDPYTWLVASTALGTMGDVTGSQHAMQKFTEYITLNSIK